MTTPLAETPPRLKPVAEERTPVAAYAIWHTLGSVVLLPILLLAQNWLHNPLALAGAFVVIGYVAYRVHFPLHDASHLSLFRSRRWNRFVGHIAAGQLLTTYRSFQALHLLHHKEFGTVDDPAGEDYYGIRFDRTRDLVWFLVKPAIGGTVIEKLRDYWGFYAGGLAHDTQKKAGQAGRNITVREIAILAAVQLVMLACAVGPSLDFWRYPVMYLLPLTTVFLFLARLRTFLEHGALEHFDTVPGRLARTTLSRGLGAAVISPMNFNYHHEHHRWPGIPSCRLPGLHQRLESEGVDWHEEEVSDSFSSSIQRARSAMSSAEG
jgi:fatty acid desaturase